MFNPQELQGLIDSQVQKMEETKKYIEGLMSLLENSSIKQQITSDVVSSAVIASVINQKLSFRDKVISEAGCDIRVYFQVIKKAVIRLGIEATDVDLSASKREILLEEYISKNPEYYNEFLSLIKEVESEA